MSSEGEIFTAENIDYTEVSKGRYLCRLDVFIHIFKDGIGDVKETFRKVSYMDARWNYWINCEKTGWYTAIPKDNRLTIQGTLKVRFEDKLNEEVQERVVEIQMKDYLE